MSEPKKLLIITYYWPPAGGPGVQRWLKFVKYLPEFNIQPIVYIPEYPTMSPNWLKIDNSICKLINVCKCKSLHNFTFLTGVIYGFSKTKNSTS